jgi:hypothetical protein
MFKNKNSLIRTIYLYLFALVGLALITIGTVRLVNLGLKTYVFTKADQQYYSTPAEPRLLPDSDIDAKTLAEKCEKSEELSEEERNLISSWLNDYENWKQKQNPEERLASRRQESAANSLAMLIVGIPLFLYHWGVIKRETDSKPDENSKK